MTDLINYILEHIDNDSVIYIVVIVGSLVGVMTLVVLGCLLVDIFRKNKE